MKKLFTILAAMLISMVGFAGEVTETISMKGFGGSTATAYVNVTQEGESDLGTGMVAYAFNPSNGQVRGNKTVIAGATVTSADVNKNWSLYNTEAMAGAIKSITITQTATGTNKFQGSMYVALGTASQGAVTSVTGAQKHTSLTATEITFDIDATKGYTYFKLCSNVKFTSGSIAGVVVKVTYVTADNPDAKKYTVTTAVNDAAMGSVSGAGEYTEGTTVSLTATPKAGYEFASWSNGSTENPLKFTLTQDTTITATFQALTPITCAEAAALEAGEVALLNAFDVVYVAKGTGNIYIKDATGAYLIYDFNLDDQLKAGDHVEGFVGVSSPYNNLPEMKPSGVSFEDLTVTSGVAPEPIEMTVAPTKADLNKYVVFNNITLSSAISFKTDAATNATISVGGSNVTLRNQFKLAASLEAGKAYNIVACVAIFNTNMQVYFVSAEEYVATPAATVVTVENTTVSEMGQNLVLQGQWNEKAITISLYPGVTKGFGVYSGEGEGDFWGTIGTDDLFANGTDATYTDNGDGTFTFKATMKDATNALYEITMNGLIPVKHTYTIAGSSDAAFGTAWDPSNAENDMFLYSGTIYAWEKYNVTLSAGKIEFKVCEDHAWTTAYPADNYVLTIPADGIYTIMIMFEAASGMVEAYAEKTGEAVVIPTVAMHGNFVDPNWADTENFTLAADELTATLVMTLAVGNYEFGMRIGGKGDWTANGVQFTRENASAVVVVGSGNLKLVADVAGEYTFTWTYATNTLAITFPAKEEPQPVATWDEIVFTEVAAAGTLDGAVFASATNAAFTLTLVDGDNRLVVDANKATYGTAEENATYTHRLKIGGKTSDKRSMTLAIPADGKLRVAARSSNSSDETRTLVIKQGDVELYNQVVKDADKVDGRYPYAYADVKKGTVTIELPIDALNFYAFGFQAVAGPTVGFENIEAAEKAVKFIENGQIFILRDGAVFNLMGARVK